MDRGSVKHGPRIDEEMGDEVDALTRGAPLESRRREEREHEPPGGQEPTPDSLISSSAERDAIELRSEIARHLRPSAFPADAATLLRVARDEHAPEDVIAALERLPTNREFATAAAAWEALGGTTETHERLRDTLERQYAAVPTEAPPEVEPDVEPEEEPEPEVEPAPERETQPGPAGEKHSESLAALGRNAIADGLDFVGRALASCARRIRSGR